jgi:hypothetical protein
MTQYVCSKCRTFTPGGLRTLNVYDDNGNEIASATGSSPFQCKNCNRIRDEWTTEWMPAQPGEIGGNWDALKKASAQRKQPLKNDDPLLKAWTRWSPGLVP